MAANSWSRSSSSLAIGAARAADNQQHRVRIAELRQRLHREIGALQGLDPTREEEGGGVTETQRSPFLRATAGIHGMEDLVVHARRHDLDPILGRAVQHLQLIALGTGGREHQVGAVHDLVLDPGAQLRIIVDAGIRLDPRQGVERRDEREIQLVLEPVPDRAREPVVRVQRVVRDALIDQVERGRDHGIDELDEIVLRHRLGRAGVEVNDPETRLHLDRIGLTRMLAPHQHIALDAGPGQGRCQGPDVDAHAPAITRAGLRERGAMNRKDGETAH